MEKGEPQGTGLLQGWPPTMSEEEINAIAPLQKKKKFPTIGTRVTSLADNIKGTVSALKVKD